MQLDKYMFSFISYRNTDVLLLIVFMCHNHAAHAIMHAAHAIMHVVFSVLRQLHFSISYGHSCDMPGCSCSK